jgi:hypothetical protein
MLMRQGAAGYLGSIGEKDKYGRTITPEQAIGRFAGINIIAPTKQQRNIEIYAKIKQLNSSFYRGIADAQGNKEKINSLKKNYEKQKKDILEEKD